jgi:hypothetical protein
MDNKMDDTETKFQNNLGSLTQSISELQRIEQQKYDKLITLAGSVNSADTQKEINQQIQEVDEINKLKNNLFVNSTSSYDLNQSQLDTSRGVAVDSMAALQIIEEDLKNKRKLLDEMLTLRNNSERMVGVNNYYANRYEAHSSVMKYIVFFCGIIILSIFLMKIGIFSDSVSSVVIIIALSIGAIIVGSKVWDLSKRSNIDFDKYSFPFDPNNVPKQTQYHMDKTTHESPGQIMISNICSDITKTAASVEDSVKKMGSDAGSGVGNGTTKGSVPAVPAPLSQLTTTSSSSNGSMLSPGLNVGMGSGSAASTETFVMRNMRNRYHKYDDGCPLPATDTYYNSNQIYTL